MNTRERILQACHAFMVPVARFLLKSGVSYKEFADVARVAFVEVASTDYGIRGRPTNLSRVSALTGISRKEVRRLRSLQKSTDERLHFNPLADVLHCWHTDPQYLDPCGHPKALSMQGIESFAELVRNSAGDLPPNAVKVELIRCGAVAEQPDGSLRAVRRHLIPISSEDNLVYRLSQALRGLASTIAFNADFSNPERGEGRIERVVFTDRIPDDVLTLIAPIIRQRVTAFTENVDDLFSSVECDKDGPSSDSFKRVGLGVYYFEDTD